MIYLYSDSIHCTLNVQSAPAAAGHNQCQGQTSQCYRQNACPEILSCSAETDAKGYQAVCVAAEVTITQRDGAETDSWRHYICCFNVFNVRQAGSDVGIRLDRVKHRAGLNECERTQMEQLKMQTECKTQLILLARLSPRSGDKAEHLGMCQRQ